MKPIKVVRKNLRIGIISITVTTASAVDTTPYSVCPFSIGWVRISLLVTRRFLLATNPFLEIGKPAVHLSLCFEEALSEIFFDNGQIILTC